MRILLINQTFHPDVVSSGQHLTDLAVRLAECGHKVTVITSRRAYDNPKISFSKRETWRQIRILRVFNTGFGKGAKWKRAADFATFIGSCCLQLCVLPKQDLVLAMTSPPLISFIAAAFSRLRGARFCYWIMDMNPDEALAAGWLRPNSFAAKWLERCSRFSLRRAGKIIVLDHFMRDRICEKGIALQKIEVIPPWSHDHDVHFDLNGRAAFRKAHRLENKFVVMYSGNHSPCHPLDTIMAAAKTMAEEKDITFCFVGGGSEFARVKEFASKHQLKNIACLPYQPLDKLAGSLSAADLHLVMMGDPFVGLVHPCKVYNIIRIGLPLLYVGPRPSHISEILDKLKGQLPCASVKHGEVERTIQHILECKKTVPRQERERPEPLGGQFSIEVLLPEMIRALEALAESR